MANEERHALTEWLQGKGEPSFLEALLALDAIKETVRTQYITAKPGRSETMVIFNTAKESHDAMLTKVWEAFCADRAASRYIALGLDPETAAIAGALDHIPETSCWVTTALTNAVKQSTLRTEPANQG